MRQARPRFQNFQEIQMKSLFALFSGILIAATAMAQDVAPDVLIKTVSKEVLDIVRKDKDIQSGNTKKAIDLVEAKVLPHFNFTRMTQLALGKDWRQASAAQQKILTDEFHVLLVRTYAKALTEYKNQTVVFKPFALKPGETDVRVRTQIKQSGAGKNIELDYDLEKSGAAWNESAPVPESMLNFAESAPPVMDQTKVSAGRSASVAATVTTAVVFSAVFCAAAVVMTGASLASVTVTVKVSVSVPPCWSSACTVTT